MDKGRNIVEEKGIENEEDGPRKLLVFALEPPMVNPREVDRHKCNIVQLPRSSQEYKLIEEMFHKGNCELNTVSKIYNKELYANFSKSLSESQTALNVSLLFFSNTMEVLGEILSRVDGFKRIYEKLPQDLLFSTDLSIAYHFFKRTRKGLSKIKSPPRLLAMRSDGLEARKWKSIIAGVVLEKVWNERKSYALFALNFDARTEAILRKGYNVIYFSKDGFYLALVPDVCIPIYLLDFTFM